jgi:hypothetical protein
MKTVTIARATGVHALLFGCLSGRDIGLMRIGCPDIQQHKHSKE